MIRPLFLLLCALTIGAASSSNAHTIWIEPADNKLVVRFAEPGEDFEISPGHLDSLSSPIAFTISTIATNAPATVEAPKNSDHFDLVGAKPTSTTCVETTFTVRGGRKPNFYARWQPNISSEEKPLLTLDLVPTGKPNEVRAYFRGLPLPGIKAKLRGPDGKDQELTADNEGFIHYTTEKPGQYLLTIAHHREPIAGFHRGVAYKETSHNTAITWIKM